MLAGSIAVIAGPALAQGNDDCFMCHADSDLTGMRGAAEMSMWVDQDEFDDSVHGGLDCVFCHQDVDPDDLPHADDLEPVDCSMCHDDQVAAHTRSLHGQAAARGDELAPTCATCHGTHDMRSHREAGSPTSVLNIPLLCGTCHREGSPVSLFRDIPQEAILEHYQDSIHGEGLFQKGLTVTAVCTSCHTSHLILPHTDTDSSIHQANVADTCQQCHGNIEAVHRQVIEGRLWEEEPHKIPVCVDCHAPHEIRRVFYDAGTANADCMKCHADPDLTTERDGATVSLFVDMDTYRTSAHAEKGCAQCHTEVVASLKRPCEPVQSPVDCAICHAGPVAEYQSSTHGTLHAAGDADAPYCLDCHDKHATKLHTVPTSPTFPRNVPLLCAECHRAGEQAAVRIDSVVPDIVQSYADSIHGKGLIESGLVVTATCADCHSAHSELPPDDPRSTVNSANIADTCGSCHHGIEETFLGSIHATGEATDGRSLPTCESCHTSHTISRHDVPGFRTLMMEQCGYCHEPEAETFFDTFHGKVSRLGAEGSAKCYDCHGAHDILPTEDPASHLSRQNVVETCARCHEGSHRQFAGYLTHATHHDKDRYPWLFWSFWFMTVLLVGTLTFALMHTLAWLMRLWLTRAEWRAHKADAQPKPGEKVYRRFNRYQRTMHIVMMVSFFTLAITGMTLKFSYAGWAAFVSRILGGFETMAVLHRLGGVALFVVFGFHLATVLRQKRREKASFIDLLTGPSTMMFTLTDIRQVGQSIRWFFGLGPRPKYGRYTYWEKFDYFAVFWGIAIIGSTGLVLWFPEIATRLIPGWSVNVATIIHSDEALLAVGFIFTIHFFNTHFRPDKFPMDPVIFTGRITLAELQHDKPAEYEALVESGRLDEHLVEQMPEPVERGFRVFGFIALTVGLTLIALIVYAMLFSYR